MTPDYEDITLHLIPAMQALGFELTVAGAQAFELQIAYREYTNGYVRAVPKQFSEEYKALLKALAGPHSKAVLKAHRIKHDLE